MQLNAIRNSCELFRNSCELSTPVINPLEGLLQGNHNQKFKGNKLMRYDYGLMIIIH